MKHADNLAHPTVLATASVHIQYVETLHQTEVSYQDRIRYWPRISGQDQILASFQDRIRYWPRISEQGEG